MLLSTGNEDDALSYAIGVPVAAIAVDAFFFLSGFLVYRSLLQRGSVMNFVEARLVRLWPGLAVAVTLTAMVGLFCGATLGRQTVRFLLLNYALQNGGYDLTGLGTVNGSLWSISLEVKCYAILAGLALVGLASPTIMKRLILPASFIAALVWHLVPYHHGHESGVIYLLNDLDRCWTLFALGITAYLFRERLVLRWDLAALLMLLASLEHWSGAHLHIQGIAVSYATLCVGFCTGRLSGRWHDYSYGMYIYGYPVMVLLNCTGLHRDYWLLTFVTVLATMPIAMASYHFVERPALTWAKARRRQREEVVDASSGRLANRSLQPAAD